MSFCIFKYGFCCNLLSDVIFKFYNYYVHLIICTWNLHTTSIKLLLLLLLLSLLLLLPLLTEQYLPQQLRRPLRDSLKKCRMQVKELATRRVNDHYLSLRQTRSRKLKGGGWNTVIQQYCRDKFGGILINSLALSLKFKVGNSNGVMCHWRKMQQAMKDLF